MPRKRVIIKIEGDFKNFLNNIDQILFINLDERKDRLKLIEEELTKISPNLEKVTRIKAEKKEIGAIGCGLSHIKALELALEKDYKNIIILEDDFEFEKNEKLLNTKINYLFEEVDFNICCLSGNIKSIKKYKNGIYHAIDVQTTSAYIIKKEFYQTLINNFKEGIETMEKNYKYGQAEIDVQWKKLQNIENKFFIFNPRLGKQRGGFSDIEKRYTNYGC